MGLRTISLERRTEQQPPGGPRSWAAGEKQRDGLESVWPDGKDEAGLRAPARQERPSQMEHEDRNRGAQHRKTDPPEEEGAPFPSDGKAGSQLWVEVCWRKVGEASPQRRERSLLRRAGEGWVGRGGSVPPRETRQESGLAGAQGEIFLISFC